MPLERFHGVFTVLQMPFRPDFSIDYGTLAREVDWNFENGVTGVVLALASEVFRLTDAERDAVVKQVVEATAGRGPVIMSVGAESTVQASRHAGAAEAAGVDAVMAIPPAMTAAPTDETVAYYEAILDAISLPVIVQDASSYVGNAIPVGEQAGFFNRNPDRVMFKPEANPLGPTISALVEATGRRARIFEGSGGLLLPESHLRGVCGTMPGGDLPWVTVALWNALENGDSVRARAIHLPLASMVSNAHNIDVFIAVAKLLLCEQGIFEYAINRPPVGYVMDMTTRERILSLFHELEGICR